MTSLAPESVSNPYGSLQYYAAMTADVDNNSSSSSFKHHNNPDDSGSNQDGASSVADDSLHEAKDRCGASSKQSAASSSGKGSSTGTSPTSAASSSTRSPKRNNLNGRAFHHHNNNGLTTPGSRYGQSLKAQSPMFSGGGKQQPTVVSTTPSTSGHDALPSATDVLTATPTASTTSLAGSATGSSTAHCMPPYRPTYHPDVPPPPFNHPMVPPPGATQLMVSSTGVYNHNQQQPNQLPALYTMTVGDAVAPASNNTTAATNSSQAAGTSAVAPSGSASTTGGGGTAAGSSNTTRQSSSPASMLNATANSNGVMMQSGVLSPSQQQHTIFVHINAGETLSVRVGQDIQHIPGPATVRMVSQSMCPPLPLPLHVPPGHLVQQICDDNGILKHLILSPQTQQVSGPFGAGPVTGPPSASTSTPGGAPASAAAFVSANGTCVTPPPAGSLPGYVGVPHSYSQPPPPFPGSQPPPAASPVFVASNEYDATEVSTYAGPMAYAPAPRGTGDAIQNGPHWKKQRQQHHRDLLPDGVFPDDEREESRSGTSGVEDEEIEKLMEMLGRVQPIQVVEVSARQATISWQPLDTSEASAYGGPFPQIDASEITYEITLSEQSAAKDSQLKSYRVFADQAMGNQQQLRLDLLKPSTEYYVRLQASLTERGLVGDPTLPVRFCTRSTIPEKPAQPRLIKRGRNHILVQWKKPADNGQPIDKYCLEITEQPDAAEWSEAYSGPNEQTKINRLEPNTSYAIRVKAYNSHGSSAASDTLFTTTVGAAPSKPQPPALATAAPDSIALCWQRRPGDQAFILQMEDALTGHGFLNACRTVETTWRVEKLRKNESYAFKLVACNDDGESAPSQPVSYSTLAGVPQAPRKPQLKDRIKGNSARVQWDPPADDGGSPVSSYTLQLQTRGSQQDWTSVYTGAEKQHTLNSLSPGTAYLLRVSCATAAGQSSPSDVFHLTTDAVPPHACAAPDIGKVRANGAHIKWAAPSNNGGADVSEFELSIAADADGSSSSPPPAATVEPVYRGSKTDYVANSLLPGQTYLTHVRAINCAGAGVWSPAAVLQTAPAVTSAPTELQLDDTQPEAIGHSHVCLRWQAPASCNGAAVSEYRLLKATSSGEQPLKYEPACTSQSTSCVVQPLLPNTQYSFVVTAVNSVGTSAESEPLSCSTLPGPPEAPVISRVAPESTADIAVEWTERSNHGLPVTSFVVECCSDDGTSRSQSAAAPADSLVVEGLEPETLYRIRVRAVNEAGQSAWSNAMKTSTFCLPPEPPRLELVSASYNALKVRWHDAKDSPATTPSASGTPLDGGNTYQLEIENKAGSYSPVFESSLSRSCKVPRLNENQSYRLRIRACNSGGAGAWSEPVAFSTTRTPPPSLKAAPRVSELTPAGSWQVEWQSIKASAVPTGDRVHYALQMAPANSSPKHGAQEDWKTVYEGASQSTVITSVAAGVPQKVRVLCVRVTPVVDEQTGRSSNALTYGAASPTVVFNNAVFTQTKQRSTTSASEPEEVGAEQPLVDDTSRVAVGRFGQLSETQFAAAGMVVFVVATLLIVWLCSSLLPQ